VLDSALTVSDVDSGGNLSGATISIGADFVAGDSLNFTNQNGISGSSNATTGVLTLTGTASQANYQTALDSITFSSTVTTAGSRTIDWTVTDGSTSNGTSATATSTVDLASGPLWGIVVRPSNPISGTHLYGLFAQSPNGSTDGELVAAIYSATTADYSNAGPDSETSYLLTMDPFLLPYASSITANGATGQEVPDSTTTIQAGDFSDNSRQLLLASTSATNTLAIGFFVTENASGTATINQFYFNEPTTGLNSAVTLSTPVAIETGLTGADLQYFTSFENNSSGIFTGTGNGAAYSLAWATYSNDTYTVDFQIFNTNAVTASSPDSDTISGTTPIQILSDTGVTSFTAAPAWFFRGAGAVTLSGTKTAIFAAASAEPVSGSDVIKFQAYEENGSDTAAGLPSFTITPNLSAYGSGATDQITVEPLSITHTYSAEALQFVPNVGSSDNYAFAWNDTITAGGNTFDQVEFAIYTASGTMVTQQTFQIPDGNQQSVALDTATIDGTNVVVLAYGDDTGTNVVEFNANTGAEMASFFNPATTIFNHVGILTNSAGTDGRLVLTYDNVLGDGVTTQYVTDIYDLRTVGLSVNDASGTFTSDQYFAGTRYGDTIVGANDVNNTYDFVGDNAGGTAPSYSFTGGTGTTASGNPSWNVVILPDTPSDYTINVTDGSGGGSGTLTDTGDPAHAGTLTVSGVQALAFSPSADPSGNPGSLVATGVALFVYGPLPAGGEPITIANGSTLQLFAVDDSTVTFVGAVGYFVDTDPTTFSGTVGVSSGTFASTDIIDLQGLNAHSTDTFQVVATLNGSNDTVLTVTDETNHDSASVTLAANYQSDNWQVTYDGGTGADIYDPPELAGVTVAAGTSLGITTPSNETVTFTGRTGSLVLNDPEGFTGQIAGFTGTAPDAAHSDTIDLVGINYNSAQFAETYNSAMGLLTVTDGVNTATITFDDFNATLDFASDGNSGTLITDPPATGSPHITTNAATDWGLKFDHDKLDFEPHHADNEGGAGADGQHVPLVSFDSSNDSFVFRESLGVEPSGNSESHVEGEAPANYAAVQEAQQLAALVAPESHHEAFIDLIHNDSLGPAGGVSPPPWHALVANSVHLH